MPYTKHIYHQHDPARGPGIEFCAPKHAKQRSAQCRPRPLRLKQGSSRPSMTDVEDVTVWTPLVITSPTHLCSCSSHQTHHTSSHTPSRTPPLKFSQGFQTPQHNSPVVLPQHYQCTRPSSSHSQHYSADSCEFAGLVRPVFEQFQTIMTQWWTCLKASRSGLLVRLCSGRSEEGDVRVCADEKPSVWESWMYISKSEHDRFHDVHEEHY